MRITTLLLAAITAISLGACRAVPPGGQSETSETPSTTAAPLPLDILKAASEKWDTATGMDAQMKLDISQSSQGVTVDIGAEGNLKLAIIQSKPQMQMDFAMTALGETAIFSVYLDSEYVYINTPGMKIKTPIEQEASGENPFDALNKMESADLAEIEKYLLNPSVKEEDGCQIVTFTISGDHLNGATKDQLDNSLGDFGITLPDNGEDSGHTETTFSDIHFTCVINADGYLDTINMDMTMTMEIDGTSPLNPESTTEITSTTTLSMEIKANNPGKEVIITPPADLDTYIEASQELNWNGLEAA